MQIRKLKKVKMAIEILMYRESLIFMGPLFCNILFPLFVFSTCYFF